MIDKDSIIVDTGFLYALFNNSDPHHFSSQRFLEQYDENKLITTCFVFAELYWLLRRENFHLINQIYAAAGKEEVFHVVPFETRQLSSLQPHSSKYQDRRIDIADASLIALAEKVGHGKILTIDSDFSIYRWNKTNQFENLFVLDS